MLYGKPKVNNADVISASYLLPREIISKLMHAREVGILMQTSTDSPFFMGFDHMPFADAAEKLPGFLNVCH